MNHSVELESASRLHLGATALALAALLLALAPEAQAGQLNDTGQITCHNNTGAGTGTVSPGTPNPVAAGFEDQDCARGAAAADALGLMTKQGASSTQGRDYTKISNAGEDLPASATLGSGASDWACTRDNITGLVWEVKVNDAAHLRHVDHTYTWYDTNGAINGGNAGSIGSDTCNGTLPSNQCNTSAFRDAVNAAGLCGATDWRLPTDFEFLGLMDFSTNATPAIDSAYFPNTPNSTPQWTSVSYTVPASWAWYARFGDGLISIRQKSEGSVVRLVRHAQ